MTASRLAAKDRSMYEDSTVFARNFFEGGNLNARDWPIYLDLYSAVVPLLPTRSLIVNFLASVPTLQKRMRKPGRSQDAAIKDEYLSGLKRPYEEWIDGFVLVLALVVPTDLEALDSIVSARSARLCYKQGNLSLSVYDAIPLIQ